MELEMENTGLENSDSQGATEGGAPSGEPQEQPSASEMIDIDSLEKFKYGGREWTPKDLHGAILANADYTRNMQKLRHEQKQWEGNKKFYENLHFDLTKIRENPKLAEEFRKVYPKEFHSYLGAIPSNPQGQSGQPQRDPELMTRLETLEREREEAQLSIVEKQLDEKFSALAKKYEYADDARVTALAEQYIKNGAQLSDEVLDKIFKADHERTQKFLETKYQQKINAQKNVNSKMRDSGSGGAIPGQAPKRPRTIKEATAMFLESEGLS